MYVCQFTSASSKEEWEAKYILIGPVAYVTSIHNTIHKRSRFLQIKGIKFYEHNKDHIYNTRNNVKILQFLLHKAKQLERRTGMSKCVGCWVHPTVIPSLYYRGFANFIQLATCVILVSKSAQN